MGLKLFDRISGMLIILSWAYAVVVAATQWNWFPEKDDWGHIADIPPNMINYLALLLPWAVMLTYLITRRLYFKKSFQDGSSSLQS